MYRVSGGREKRGGHRKGSSIIRIIANILWYLSLSLLYSSKNKIGFYKQETNFASFLSLPQQPHREGETIGLISLLLISTP